MALLGWSTYEVVLTRLSRVDNSWVWPNLAGLSALFLLSIGAVWASSASRSLMRRSLLAVLGIALTILAGVIWAAKAPLPELRVVPRPPPSATPEQVVTSFVAALDGHDHLTAEALCARWACPLDDDVWVRIAHFGPVVTDNQACVPVKSDGSCVPRSGGVDVNVELTGLTRSGELPGEGGVWEYVLAPIGPHGAWRIVGQGTG